VQQVELARLQLDRLAAPDDRARRRIDRSSIYYILQASFMFSVHHPAAESLDNVPGIRYPCTWLAAERTTQVPAG
jgi:hypothetical protein